MSYDLDVLARGPGNLDREALEQRARARAPGVALTATTTPGSTRLAVDGEGFVVARTPRGVHLSAGGRRGPGDERLMELLALDLAQPDGAVVDRHTGRAWPAPLLAEWLQVAGLFSGRALCLNEERIAHRQTSAAAPALVARIEALVAHVVATPRSTALEARLRDELAPLAVRPALVWPVARALAALGDFARLEALARAPAPDDAAAPSAFAVAAEYGPAAVPLFAQALGDADPNHRRAAARALHLIAHPGVLPLVVRALEDKRATVREAVFERGFDRVLALAGAVDALAPELRRLAQDPNSTVRRRAAAWTDYTRR